MTRRRFRQDKPNRVLKILIGLLLVTGLSVIFPCKGTYASPAVTIVIDPGHGGESQDGDETNSGCKYHGLEEKNVNLITALAMYDELSQYGNVNVYITRDIDAPVTLERRVEFAGEVGADVIISIHYNASADHNFFGSEIFTSAYGECYAVGHALGEEIMQEWVDEGNIRKDIKTRVGKHGDYYGLIRNGTERNIPTIILEHGYLDNDRDYQRIRNEDAWKQFGILDATAVARFYGLEKGIVKEKIGPSTDINIPESPVMPDDTAPEGVKLEINEYNSDKGDIKYTLFAYDDESKLMYYGFETGSVDEDTVFDDLELWDGNNGKLKGSFHVPPGYKGKLTAKVYNVFQLDSVSNTVELIPEDDEEDEDQDEEIEGSDDGGGEKNAGSKTAKSLKKSGTSKKQRSKTKAEVTSGKASDASEYSDEDDGPDETKEGGEYDWMIGGELPAEETTAVANAIDKNTGSAVYDSYTGLLVMALIAAVALTVAVIIATSLLAERKRERQMRRRKMNRYKERDTFDWADRYDKD